MRKITALAFGVVAMLASTMAYAETLMDRVAIVVNEEVILESELNDLIANVRSEMGTSGANAPSETAIRTQATERLITQKLQMQMANRMGIQIDDAFLEQALASIASENNLSVEGLRLEITSTGASWAEYREEIRKQIVMSEVQRSSIQRRIYMSPQEIDLLMNLISEQGANSTEYRVSHILIGLQNEEGEVDEIAARSRAEQVLELARNGDDFAQLAITASSAQNALEGGDMGWMSINAMPTLFANALQNQEQGYVAGLLRSGLGFHILKIQDVRGAQQAVNEEVRSRHILIRPSVILSDNRAQQMLNEFREQIQSGEKTFAELASANSADTASAAQGGVLEWAPADVYVPEFRDRVARMEPNVISEPFKTTHGWHIVEVLERRQQDVTEQRMREQAQQILYSRKFQEEMEVWLQELRDNAFVDIRI
ncbi:parvulin-like peptidyl-prolyl isomerase [Idiomarina sp. A28L]|uniref:peptidylprolyl isomerase SurA n=1 Tax=Idiomarina sp. A28L TaxID=1036674 RepID=UPI0002138701|nr:peptidylprolyl isomerase SurA [Idiomarina sp. A28L]EGN75268.1 parvulin-like peptidyl-prolyl isomerase [Idiomarina sp. A28L]